MKSKTEINMTEGNLFKKLIVVALPLLCAGLLQLLYNAADLIVCGKFGSDNSVAAISSTNALVNLIINLFMGLSVGANVLMARCFGEKNKEKGQRVVYTAMISSLICGVFIGAFGFLMSKIFLGLMGTPSEVINLSNIYLKIYFLGVPFSMIYNFGASLLRAIGDTKRPFYFLALSGLVNVLLNLFFVIVLKMDVAGVSLATIISQALSAFLVVLCMIRNKGFFYFDFKEIRFYKKEALEILKIGIPAGLQGTLFSLSNVLIQSSINSLGTDIMNGNGAAASLEGFVYVSMNSIANACIAFVSANYGAGNKENIKKVIIYTCIIVVLMNFIVGSFIMLLQNQLLGLYVSTEEALIAGKQRLTAIILTYFLCGLMDTLAYSLRGIGYSLTPTIVSLLGVCGVRLLWIYTIFKIDNFHNILGIALSYPISWIITVLTHLIILLIVFRKIKFLKQINN